MEVKIEYGDKEDPALSKDEHKFFPKTIATLRLKDIADLKARGIRAGQEQRAQANGKPVSKPPEPIGRVTIVENESLAIDEDSMMEDIEGIQLDGKPYIEAMKDTDWKMYDECSQYLVEAESRRRYIGKDR